MQFCLVVGVIVVIDVDLRGSGDISGCCPRARVLVDGCTRKDSFEAGTTPLTTHVMTIHHRIVMGTQHDCIRDQRCSADDIYYMAIRG